MPAYASSAKIASAEAKLGGPIALDSSLLLKQLVVALGNVTGGGGGGGSGTVTSFSFTNGAGISGVVTNPTTTPALALTLGAITPTSVNGLTLTAAAVGFTVSGGTTSKTLTISNTLALAGVDGSTLTIPATGTAALLGTANVFSANQSIASGNTLDWNSDLYLGRSAAATLLLGVTHATTATAQTIVSHSVTTGTGANMIIGAGTGSVAGGSVILATRATTGALTPRLTVAPSGNVTMTGSATATSFIAPSGSPTVLGDGTGASYTLVYGGTMGIYFQSNSTNIARICNSAFIGFSLNPLFKLGWGTNDADSLTTFFMRKENNAIQMGENAASSQVSQVFSACGARIGTDTNTTPTNKLTVAGPHNTGTGTGGDLCLGVYGTNGASGTAIGTLNTVLTIVAARKVVNISSIPTSSAGLSAGDIYSNAGVLTIV